MDKVKKKRIKKYIAWIFLAALVVGLTVMPLLASDDEESDGPQASILSGTVEIGSVDTVLRGGGNLTSSDAVEVTIPSGVKITEFLVSNGDIVTEGTPLATIDRVSVMSAITSVQDTLEYLVEEMNEVTDEEVSSTVTAQAGGRVKVVYGQAGDSVQDVMLEHGALAVLSLDGLMAVQIERYTDLVTGDAVTVTFSDDTEVTGRVESNLDGILTVTIDDAGFEIGEKVKVTTTDGDRIGSGNLYVHNAWNATAYSGTIAKVNVSAETTVSAGKTLFTLTDTSFTAQLNSLANQHRDYEALMLELFVMYQDCVITAPCDGMISGIDEDSIHLLASSGGFTLSFLANSPNGNDDASYTNFIGMVTGTDGGAWELVLNPTPMEITDYKDLSGVSTDPTAMTEVGAFVPTVPIYELVSGQWQQIEAYEISVGDTLLFAGDENGSFVWVVRIAKVAADPEDPEVTEPETPSEDPTDSTEPSDETTPSEPTDETVTPGTGSQQGGQSSQGGMSGGFAGGYSSGTQAEEEYDLFDLEGSVLMSVTAQEEMTLTITLDEQDISKVYLGQTAEVRVDALKNEVFSATVSAIGLSGTSNGGSSKFTVELTLDKTEDMLSGMSATATITLSTTENVLTIPVAALVEQGAETIVYTALDENGNLTAPVTVTVGVSDGENVQILSGLTQGDSYYYAYYDTLEISTQAESASQGGFSFFFGK